MHVHDHTPLSFKPDLNLIQNLNHHRPATSSARASHDELSDTEMLYLLASSRESERCYVSRHISADVPRRSGSHAYRPPTVLFLIYLYVQQFGSTAMYTHHRDDTQNRRSLTK